MDNFQADITSEGKEQLKLAFKLFARKSEGYRIFKLGEKYDFDEKIITKPTLVFYWYIPENNKDIIPFPIELNELETAEMAHNWLMKQDYKNEPDHDGDNGKGWRLFNEDWGHVFGDSRAFVAVQPEWAMYGK